MSEPIRACRNCVFKKVCRWFPEVPADFVVREAKYKGAMQIELEKLYAAYCHWYELEEDEA